MGYRHYLPSGWRRWPYRIYDLATCKAAVKGADAVVVSSRLEHADAVDFGVDPGKIHVIPMGIDVASCPPAAHEESAALKLLFVGRIARVRRVELILQAAQRLPFAWTLTIVGGEEKTSSVTRSGYLDELKTLARGLGIEERVRFAGPGPHEALSAFYQAADVFVYPSRYENFGQPVLEAAAHGLPLIAAPVGVAAQLLDEGRTGFAAIGDPDALAGRIAELRAADTRRAFGHALRERVAREFTWDTVIDRYLGLYRSF